MKKSFKVLIGVVGGLFIAISLVMCCVVGISYTGEAKDYFGGEANPYISADGAMVSAHRAGSSVAPENTLHAFELGIEEATTGGYKVDIWEFDLHITADEQLILLHDHTLDRTSDSEQVFGVKDARPEDYTLAELKKLNMGYNFELNGEYPFRELTPEQVTDAGLDVCTLGDVLDYMESDEARAAAPDGRFSYIIEIKNSGKLGERAADLLYAELSSRGLLPYVVFGTFNQNVSDYVDAHYPDMLRSSSICEVLDFWLAYLTGADLSKRGVGYCALQIPYSSSISFLGTKGLIEYAHKYNIAVQYWTINDAEEMRSLINARADGIITDNPSMASKVLERQKAD